MVEGEELFIVKVGGSTSPVFRPSIETEERTKVSTVVQVVV